MEHALGITHRYPFCAFKDANGICTDTQAFLSNASFQLWKHLPFTIKCVKGWLKDEESRVGELE